MEDEPEINTKGYQRNNSTQSISEKAKNADTTSIQTGVDKTGEFEYNGNAIDTTYKPAQNVDNKNTGDMPDTDIESDNTYTGKSDNTYSKSDKTGTGQEDYTDTGDTPNTTPQQKTKEGGKKSTKHQGHTGNDRTGQPKTDITSDEKFKKMPADTANSKMDTAYETAKASKQDINSGKQHSSLKLTKFKSDPKAASDVWEDADKDKTRETVVRSNDKPHKHQIEDQFQTNNNPSNYNDRSPSKLTKNSSHVSSTNIESTNMENDDKDENRDWGTPEPEQSDHRAPALEEIDHTHRKDSQKDNHLHSTSQFKILNSTKSSSRSKPVRLDQGENANVAPNANTSHKTSDHTSDNTFDPTMPNLNHENVENVEDEIEYTIEEE